MPDPHGHVYGSSVGGGGSERRTLLLALLIALVVAWMVSPGPGAETSARLREANVSPVSSSAPVAPGSERSPSRVTAPEVLCVRVLVVTRDSTPVVGAVVRVIEAHDRSPSLYRVAGPTRPLLTPGPWSPCVGPDMPTISDAEGIAWVRSLRQGSTIVAKHSVFGVGSAVPADGEQEVRVTIAAELRRELLVVSLPEKRPIAGAEVVFESTSPPIQLVERTDDQGTLEVALPEPVVLVRHPDYESRYLVLRPGTQRIEVGLRPRTTVCLRPADLGPMEAEPLDSLELVLHAELYDHAFEEEDGRLCSTLPPGQRYRLRGCGAQACAETPWMEPGFDGAPSWRVVHSSVVGGVVIDAESRFGEVDVLLQKGFSTRRLRADSKGRFRAAVLDDTREVTVHARRGSFVSQREVVAVPKEDVELRLRAPALVTGRVRPTEACRPPVKLAIDGQLVTTNSDGHFELAIDRSLYGDQAILSVSGQTVRSDSCLGGHFLCNVPCELAFEALTFVGTMRVIRPRSGRPLPKTVLVRYLGHEVLVDVGMSGELEARFALAELYDGELPNAPVRVTWAGVSRAVDKLARLGPRTWSFGEVVFVEDDEIEVHSVDDVGRALAGSQVRCECTGTLGDDTSGCVTGPDGRCTLRCSPEGRVWVEPLDLEFLLSSKQDVAGAHTVVVRSRRAGGVRGRCPGGEFGAVELVRDNKSTHRRSCSEWFGLTGLEPGTYVMATRPRGLGASVQVLPGHVTDVVLAPGFMDLPTDLPPGTEL